MTRRVEEVDRVLALGASGLNHCEISRRTAIPRSTIRMWLTGQIPDRSRPEHLRRGSCPRCGHPLHRLEGQQRPTYAYLLGLYLGDGCISANRRGVFRLRIVLDAKYPGIIDECAGAMRLVMPINRVSIRSDCKGNAKEVSSFSRQWPCLFPQHGPGRKHLRPIVLKGWQREITGEFPDELIRGLIHSDGCRCTNKVRAKTYAYTRYLFSNRSSDIKEIFCEHCDLLGVAWRRDGPYAISVARRESTAILDEVVGPKT